MLQLGWHFVERVKPPWKIELSWVSGRDFSDFERFFIIFGQIFGVFETFHKTLKKSPIKIEIGFSVAICTIQIKFGFQKNPRLTWIKGC